MGWGPTTNTPDRVLLARIQTLYAQLNNTHIRTPDYERLSVEIHTLAIAYDTLVDAKHVIQRSDAKP